MEENKIIPEEKNAELNDEQLNSVAGGLLIQTGSVTCPKCGKMFLNSAERESHERICRG